MKDFNDKDFDSTMRRALRRRMSKVVVLTPEQADDLNKKREKEGSIISEEVIDVKPKTAQY